MYTTYVYMYARKSIYIQRHVPSHSVTHPVFIWTCPPPLYTCITPGKCSQGAALPLTLTLTLTLPFTLTFTLTLT